jgi:hypothetical protein
LLIAKVFPSDFCPSVILVTDGVAAVPDYGTYDNTIMLLNREDLSINVIHVGNGEVPHVTFSLLPDPGMSYHQL